MECPRLRLRVEPRVLVKEMGVLGCTETRSLLQRKGLYVSGWGDVCIACYGQMPNTAR